MYRRAAYWANEVIASHKHDLNESYEEIFINMIRDQYDTQFHESMWEAEFLGDRTSATDWTNGRIGDLIGLRSQSRTTNYSEVGLQLLLPATTTAPTPSGSSTGRTTARQTKRPAPRSSTSG